MRAEPRGPGLLLVLLLGSACSARAPESAPVTLGPPVVQPDRRPVVTEGRGYLLLADGSQHFASDGEPRGLFVEGTIEGGRFIPEGDVLGEGPFCDPGEATGFLQLIDASFYSRKSSHSPLPPYVEGTVTVDGLFRPSSRRVYY